MAFIENEELSDEGFDNIEQDGAADVAPVVEKPKIPDKYSGKSLEDIVQMHQEAEKLIGRQAQEVGEVRKLADDLIKQQLSSKQETPVQEENEIDFFEDPKKAVRNAVDKHPDVLAAKQAALEMKQMRTQEALNKKHPDMAEIVKDGEFIEWVKASPVRLNMYAQADANYDLASADELLSTFKQIRTVKAQQQNDGSQALKQSLKAASVDTGGTGVSSQKVYRRADLIRLRMTDPKRYESLSDEIMSAYAEGRVK
jgi:hypothetical protein